MGSGGWRNGSGAGLDDDEEEEEAVQVAETPLHKKPTTSIVDEQKAVKRQGTGTDTILTVEEEEELRIPGSFDMSNPRHGKRSGSADDDGDDDDDGGGEADEDATWAGLFRKMGLK
jgi:calcium/calmodulin-dependent protein kinase I